MRCREVLWRRLGHGLVLVGPSPDEPTIVGAPGQLVWDLLGRARQLEDLVDDLVQATGEDRERLRSDLDGLLVSWERRGWVELVRVGEAR